MVTGPAHYPQSCGRQIFAGRLALHLSQNPNGIPYDSPGLRAPRYPGKGSRRMINPNGVVSSCFNPNSISCFSFDPFCRMFLQQPTSFVRTQPRWGWDFKPVIPQGSAVRATLGYGTESRWDSRKRRHSCPQFALPTLWVTSSYRPPDRTATW